MYDADIVSLQEVEAPKKPDESVVLWLMLALQSTHCIPALLTRILV